MSLIADEAADTIDRLRAERDEARREVCVWQGLDTGSTPRDTATVRGWDCFKQTMCKEAQNDLEADTHPG
jgi:hypothetical protein